MKSLILASIFALSTVAFAEGTEQKPATAGTPTTQEAPKATDTKAEKTAKKADKKAKKAAKKGKEDAAPKAE